MLLVAFAPVLALDYATASAPLFRREVAPHQAHHESGSLAELSSDWWFWTDPVAEQAAAKMHATEAVSAVNGVSAEVITAAPNVPFPSEQQGEKDFFYALGNEIRKSWFLQGHPMILMVGSRPYLLTPSRDSPIKAPEELAASLDPSQDVTNPAIVAHLARNKRVSGIVMWFPDMQNLLTIATKFNLGTLAELHHQSKLRAFLQGREYSLEEFGKFKKHDILHLNWATKWIHGGMGSDNLLGLAVQKMSDAKVLVATNLTR